jgi:hypothetical protein
MRPDTLPKVLTESELGLPYGAAPLWVVVGETADPSEPFSISPLRWDDDFFESVTFFNDIKTRRYFTPPRFVFLSMWRRMGEPLACADGSYVASYEPVTTASMRQDISQDQAA